MSRLDDVFKFKIGDLLQMKAVSVFLTSQPAYERSRGCFPLMVTTRTCEECPGGAQIHYTVRGIGGDMNGVRLHEMELEPYVAPVEKKD